MLNNESHNLLGTEQASLPTRSKRRRYCTYVSLFILGVLLLGIVVLAALAAGPLHAQCSVKWTISLPCGDVSSLLVNQIKSWTTDDCPGNSQKCLYALVSVGDDDIIATHTTPVLRFVDDIKFVFRPAEHDSCLVLGHSVSRSWYAILDSGTNYRNMYNLMKGSGLSSTPGFSEFTCDRNCTQYSTAKQHPDL